MDLDLAVDAMVRIAPPRGLELVGAGAGGAWRHSRSLNVRRTVPEPSFGMNETATLTVKALPRWRLSAARTLRVSLTLIFSRAGERNVRRAGRPRSCAGRPSAARRWARSTVAFAVRRPSLLVRAKKERTPLRVIVASLVELRC